VINIDFTV